DSSLDIDAYTEEIFRRLLSVANDAALTPSEQDTYDYWMKIARDNYCVMDYERKQARAEGHAEGLAEGRQESALEIAARLKAQNIATDIIVTCTGLTAEAVAAL
ncbi:MAG: hypothetical protein J5699_02890, partial [Bacteroidales bacterium]|nr:hypothetical protein [Bacteroidales bacterium]